MLGHSAISEYAISEFPVSTPPATGNRRRRVLISSGAEMNYARQSTAIIVTVGPVLDADGVAVTDGVVGDFKISKNGGAPGGLNGSATLTHRNTGHYSLALTATDVNTVGTVEVVIDDTVNACPMKELQVVSQDVYDMLYQNAAIGYIDNQPVDMDTIKGQAVTCAASVTVSPFIGSTGAAVNGTNANTLAGHDPGETIMGATDLASKVGGLANDGSAGLLLDHLYLQNNSVLAPALLITNSGGVPVGIDGAAPSIITSLECFNASLSGDIRVTDASGNAIATATALAALFSAAQCNKIADHVRRRSQTSVEASSDGDTLTVQSLYGIIQQMQESNTTTHAGKLTVFKRDGTTELAQITLATDPAAEPVTGVS